MIQSLLSAAREMFWAQANVLCHISYRKTFVIDPTYILWRDLFVLGNPKKLQVIRQFWRHSNSAHPSKIEKPTASIKWQTVNIAEDSFVYHNLQTGQWALPCTLPVKLPFSGHMQLSHHFTKLCISDVVYSLDCICGHCYLGRTSQKLRKRIKQHVPDSV